VESCDARRRKPCPSIDGKEGEKEALFGEVHPLFYSFIHDKKGGRRTFSNPKWEGGDKVPPKREREASTAGESFLPRTQRKGKKDFSPLCV